MPSVALTVNGTRFLNWTEVTVRRSLDVLPWSFEFYIKGPWQEDRKRLIKRNDRVEIKFDNEVMITGFVARIPTQYDAKSHERRIVGYSKLVDLFDCAGLLEEFNNLSLFQIAQRICQPFGIKVINEAGDSTPFSRQVLSEGERYWDFLEELSRLRGLRLCDSPTGDLVIKGDLNRVSNTSLTLGKNIESASSTKDSRDLYSNYRVVSNESVSWTQSAESAALPVGVSDDNLGRHRPIVIISSHPATNAECQQLADLQKRVSRARSEASTYTVKGWAQEDGSTWEPGVKVLVSDSYADINGERAIMEVRSIIDREGERSEITIMPEYAVERLPVPEEENAGIFGQ